MKAGEAVCGLCGTIVARFDLETRQWVAVPTEGHAWPHIDHDVCKASRGKKAA